jgi:hypothetical protein
MILLDQMEQFTEEFIFRPMTLNEMCYGDGTTFHELPDAPFVAVSIQDKDYDVSSTEEIINVTHMKRRTQLTMTCRATSKVMMTKENSCHGSKGDHGSEGELEEDLKG